jgi:tripartite-type tricarboxylate transporter receptor subunit TctC
MDIVRRAAVLASAVLLSGFAFGQGGGSKPLILLVPFAPGGNADIVARATAVPIGNAIGQSVVVDNRGGGGGSIGTAVVAKGPADGSLVLAATPAQLGTLPHLLKTNYRSSDFTPIGIVSRTSIAVIVRQSDSRFKTAEEFIAFAKANPGKLNVGHAGPGSPNHIAMLQFENASGAKFAPIAYKGSGPALIDLLSGQIDVMFDQVSSSLPHLKSGALSALVVLAPARDANIPNVRILKEAGLPEFDASTYIGLLVPKDVPAPAVAKLSSTLEQIARDPAFGQRLRDIGSSAHYADGKRFGEIIKADEALAVALIKQGRLVNE